MSIEYTLKSPISPDMSGSVQWESTGQSLEWYEHVFTVNNTKITEFTCYKHHLFMINFIFVNFYKILNFHNIVDKGKQKWKKSKYM